MIGSTSLVIVTCRSLPEAMVYFEYYHKEPQIAGELCQILEASGQVVPDDLRRIAREVEEGLSCLLWGETK